MPCPDGALWCAAAAALLRAARLVLATDSAADGDAEAASVAPADGGTGTALAGGDGTGSDAERVGALHATDTPAAAATTAPTRACRNKPMPVPLARVPPRLPAHEGTPYRRRTQYTTTPVIEPESLCRDLGHCCLCRPPRCICAPLEAAEARPGRAHARHTAARNPETAAELQLSGDAAGPPTPTRGALDALALRLDGKTAAAKTIGRKRAVFHNALSYAVELERLPVNPIGRVQWHTPKTTQAVDKRAVVNPRQARALLRAVRACGTAGERLEVMFALMYFAALRPAEALSLRAVDCELPITGWGEALLGRSAPRVGSAWTDSGRSRDERGLKHRADGDVRHVPLCPELVVLIRRHLDRFGTAPDGRIVATAQGAVASDSWYGRVWSLARTMALSETQAASPLAQRPYDLRHAAVSTWLNAGVPATQVAEWAGHTVEVLLKVYAKCLDGQEERAKRLIETALAEQDDTEASGGEGRSTN